MGLREGLAHIMQHADTLAQEIHAIYDAGNIFGTLSAAGTSALDIPEIYYNFAAVGSENWRTDAADAQIIDTSGAWKVSAKFRGTTDPVQDQELFLLDSTAGDKYVRIRSPEFDIFWFDNGTSTNFTTITWSLNTWYLLEIESTDGATKTCTLTNLHTGAVQTEDKTTGVGDASAAATRSRIGVGTSARPYDGDLAEVKYWQDGELKLNCPIDEGSGTAIVERVQGGTTTNIQAGGRWIPTTTHGDWASYTELSGFTGGNSKEVITRAEFTAETGKQPPANHTGSIMKITITEENTTPEITLTVTSHDISGRTSWCPRYYISNDDYFNWGTGGYVYHRLLDLASKNVHTRALQKNLSGIGQPGLNYPIFDPNDDTWLNGTNNNSVSIAAGFDNTDIRKNRIAFHSDTIANGFSGPITVYVFDWLFDVGHDVSTINVMVGWDDGNDDAIDTIDGYANTHTIKNTSFLQTDGVDVSAQKLTAAEIATLVATGRWEFAPHCREHISYETKTAAGVRSDIDQCATDMTALSLSMTDSYKVGSKPTNADKLTTDGEHIPTIERARGRKASRRGMFGMYNATAGMPDAMQIGSIALGQGSTNLTTYAEWSAFHAKLKTMGCSYAMYGHTIAAAAPTGLEWLEADLDSMFTDLRVDIDAGAVNSTFAGEFAEAMGIEL